MRASMDAMQRERRNAALPARRAGFPPALEIGRDLGAALGRARRAGCGALARVSRHARSSSRPHLARRHPPVPGPPRASRRATGLLPHQVAARGAGRPAGRGAVRPDLRDAKSAPGLPTAMTVASRDAGIRQGAGAAPVGAEVSRLHAIRPHRRGGRRRRQERDRHRRGHRRRHGIRGQHPRGADHARPRRDDAARASRSAQSARPSWGSPALGDLVLTCTDDQSRNRRLGLALGRGALARATPSAPSGRWSRACRRGARCATSRSARAWTCRSASRSTASCTRRRPVRDALQALMGREVRSETE